MNELVKSIVPLLTYTYEDGELKSTGAMSPVMCANAMAEAMEVKFDHLARIWFHDEVVLNCKDGKGITGFDTLVSVKKYSNSSVFLIFQDQGYRLMPICVYFTSDSIDDLNVTPLYDKANDYIIKPTVDDIREIVKIMIDKPETYMSHNYEDILEQLKVEANGKT